MLINYYLIKQSVQLLFDRYQQKQNIVYLFILNNKINIIKTLVKRKI